MKDWEMFFGALSDLLAAEKDAPVRSPVPPETAARDLSLDIPAIGRPLKEVLQTMVRLGEVSPLTNSPRFFNQLFSGRIDVAVMADMFASLFNNSMYTYRVAGPHAVVEKLLVDKLNTYAGFPDGEGTFTPGGSLSNLLGMVLARDSIFPGAADKGWPANSPVAYTSDLSHYSVTKNAALVGLGRKNMVKVATDAQGRMSPTALKAAIETDIAAGRTPFMVNLTAGTTVLGAFDPIPDCAAVAKAHGLWVHVDGAFGGSMLLSASTRHRLKGIETVDSFTWDAHKLMGVPLTSSVCLVRERGLLRKSLAASADYLFQDDGFSLDRGQTSLQCGRRNDALKLWAAWSYLGDEGYARRIETLVERAQYAVARINREPALHLTKGPESTNVCFSIDGIEPRALTIALTDQQRAMVGYAKVDGKDIIRIAFTDPNTGNADIDVFFDEILAVCAQHVASVAS